MSQRNRNHRAATLCSKATGTRYRKCLEWEEAGLISVRQPVPDAAGPDQRRFEAMIVLTLAEALRDSQLDGALLGIDRVEPGPLGIRLYPHPDMAKRVVRELLPRVVSEERGEILGVPGLRLRWQHGAFVLFDLTTGAQAHLIWPRRVLPLAADLEAGGRALWQHGRLGGEEEHDRVRWTGEIFGEEERRRLTADMPVRDWAMSRILRRIALVNQGSSPHGFANTYSHFQMDLIIESCCGTDPAESKRLLLQSGMTVAPSDPLRESLTPSSDGEGWVGLSGHIGVAFRCREADRRERPHDVSQELIDRVRREWYS